MYCYIFTVKLQTKIIKLLSSHCKEIIKQYNSIMKLNNLFLNEIQTWKTTNSFWNNYHFKKSNLPQIISLLLWIVVLIQYNFLFDRQSKYNHIIIIEQKNLIEMLTWTFSLHVWEHFFYKIYQKLVLLVLMCSYLKCLIFRRYILFPQKNKLLISRSYQETLAYRSNI